MIGVYLNRGRFVITCALVPIIIALWFAEDILIATGQDPLVSHHAAYYIRLMIPQVIISGQDNCMARLFTSCKMAYIPMYI